MDMPPSYQMQALANSCGLNSSFNQYVNSPPMPPSALQQMQVLLLGDEAFRGRFVNRADHARRLNEMRARYSLPPV
jgi:hypothetical protein